MAIHLGICCPATCTSLIWLVTGLKSEAKIKEIRRYREMLEKYHPIPRRVRKNRRR